MFLQAFVNNLLTIPMLAFVAGIGLAAFGFHRIMPSKLQKISILCLLFLIGFKGGVALMQGNPGSLIILLLILIAWGLLQPLLAYPILRRFTSIDPLTAATIAACFGSVSVMTYVAATAFLDKLGLEYNELIMTALAIMEVPAIIAGLWIARRVDPNQQKKSSVFKLIFEAVCNPAIGLLVLGMAVGVGFMALGVAPSLAKLLLAGFNPLLCLFLFSMGLLVGKHRDQLKQFSLSLTLFGLYMPLIGGCLGIALSSLLGMNVGTGVLIATLMASASYIAVPAAMRMALPSAKESIYLPLSMGVTFPFNVLIGIPLYYQLANWFLSP